METLFNDPLGGPPADYSDPSVVGRTALRWRFEYGPNAGQANACGGTATWRVRFGIPASEARSVWNPILHLDRLGGNQASNFDTAVMAFPQPITKLAGQAKFEQMSATEVRRQVPWVVVTPSSAECLASDPNSSMSCGSVRVNGQVVRNLQIGLRHADGSPSGSALACSTADQAELILEAFSDVGDAPASYGRAVHSIRDDRPTGPSGGGAGGALVLGPVNTDDENTLSSAAADTDPGDDAAAFSTVGDGDPGAFQVTGAVTGTNTTGSAAMLCGYLDGAADGVISGGFDSAVTYAAGQVGLSNPTVGAGNEELCVQVPLTGTTAVALAGGSNPASATCTGGTAFSCSLTWNPDYLSDVETFVRFRLTTDADFFSDTSPSAIGVASDGEVEDYHLDIHPTAVTIGEVSLSEEQVSGFLAGLGTEGMAVAALLDLLDAWDPDRAAALAGADREEILSELQRYLDPDGDGQVVVLNWETLEERGTAGFFAERRVGQDGWVRVTGDMLPGMVAAPLGAEYRLADPEARSGAAYEYRLIELEVRGSQRTYGPWHLTLP